MAPRGPARRIDAGETTAAAYLTALGAMDEEGLVAVFAPDAVAFLPPGSAPVVGRSQIRELIRCVFAAAVPVRVREELVVGAGESLAVKWTGRWRVVDGEVTFGGIDVFTLDRDGRIGTWWAYWDRSAFLSDLVSEPAYRYQDDEGSGP